MRLACVALVAVAAGPDMVGAFAPSSAFAPGLAGRSVARVSAARPFAAVAGARHAPRVLDLQATVSIQPDQQVPPDPNSRVSPQWDDGVILLRVSPGGVAAE